MKQVLIMRGPPGYGKSTRARNIRRDMLTSGEVKTFWIVSADDYFMDHGVYRFDPSRLGAAHSQCLRIFIQCLHDNYEVVVVDNTNITVAEIAPYYAVAQAFGYDAKILTVMCDPTEAANRNVHGVPFEKVQLMAYKLVQELKQIPPWWNHEYI